MNKSVFIITILLFSTNISSQSWEDITAAGLDFLLKSDKGKHLNNDQQTGLSVLENLLRKQGDRNFQLELTREGRTIVNIDGKDEEVKLLSDPEGTLYLLANGKVLPLNSEITDETKRFSSKTQSDKRERNSEMHLRSSSIRKKSSSRK